ncbi:MAG: hypothetical protein K2L87_05315 [Clostridiales bacterium]|nr:hypothetical protein [Clostridiales bacterium]
MSEQAIVERIISDAEAEARAIIAEAEEKAKATIAAANTEAERAKKGTEAVAKAKAESIFEGKAAAARLDGAKILLSEKRGVIDTVYARALEKLLGLSEKETLTLCARLLDEHAEEGDELVFAENFRFAQAVSALPVVKKKKLKVSPKYAKIDGGFMLCGKNSDKNLSYGAILAMDREEKQAEIASVIFRSGLIDG